jgi:hypothetical protein
LTRNKTSQPPWDFLLSATRNTLQSYELSRLNHAANLGKEIKQLLDAYVEESSNARLARLLMEQQENQPCGETGTPENPVGGIPEVAAHPVSDNVSPDQGQSRGRSRTMA